MPNLRKTYRPHLYTRVVEPMGNRLCMVPHATIELRRFGDEPNGRPCELFSTCLAARSELMIGSVQQAFMLDRYGLAAPSAKCFSRNRGDTSGDWLTEHPDSGMLVAIPRAPTTGRKDSGIGGGFASIGYGEPGHEHRRDAVADLSLSLPPDADERFRQNLSNLQVDVIEMVDSLMQESYPRPLPKRSFTVIPRAEVRPRWRICVDTRVRW